MLVISLCLASLASPCVAVEPAAGDEAPGLIVRVYEGSCKAVAEIQRQRLVGWRIAETVGMVETETRDHVALEFSGRLRIGQAGAYRFATISDEGSCLWIDGQLVVDNDGAHARKTEEGAITLQPGLHDLRILWFNDIWYPLFWGRDGDQMRPLAAPDIVHQPSLTAQIAKEVETSLASPVDVAGAGRPLTVPPPLAAAAADFAPGLVVRVHQGVCAAVDVVARMRLVASRVASDVSLVADEQRDQIGLRFDGYLRIAQAGDYHFQTRSDDGSVLRIHGVTVVDNDGEHSAQTRGGRVHLEAGIYPFAVIWYNGVKNPLLEVSWGLMDRELQSLPDTVLFHRPAEAAAARDEVAQAEAARPGSRPVVAPPVAPPAIARPVPAPVAPPEPVGAKPTAQPGPVSTPPRQPGSEAWAQPQSSGMGTLLIGLAIGLVIVVVIIWRIMSRDAAELEKLSSGMGNRRSTLKRTSERRSKH
jgi:hypothetical protein